MGSGPGTLVQRTSSGVVAAQGQPAIVTAVVLTGGSAAATVDLRSGGASGAVLLSLAAPLGDTRSVVLGDGGTFPDGVYASISGAGALVSVCYA